MAFLIGNTPVIDNNRNLANIATFDSTVQSPWDSITTTSVNKTLVNREWCTVTANNLTLALPGYDFYYSVGTPGPLDVGGWEIQITVGNFTNTTIICPSVTAYTSQGFGTGRTYGTINGTSDTSLIIDVPYATIRLLGYFNSSEIFGSGSGPTGSPKWRIL